MIHPTVPPIAETGKQRALLTHDRMLGRRVYIHSIVRFAVAATVAAGTLFAERVVGVTGLDVTGILTIAAAIALYNVVILALAFSHRLGTPPDRIVRLRVLKHAATLLDYIALTVIIWFLGGVRSPFVAFYLFHIIIASVLLPLRTAVVSALTAAALLTGLALVELTGILPPRLPAGAVIETGPADGRSVATILVVNIFLFGLTTVLLTSLAHMLRHGEQQLLDQADKLERLNAQRRDLLHLTLHNLQSPVAAAGMLLRNLANGLCGPLTAPQSEQLDRSLYRLDSISGFIRDLGVLARLESDDIATHAEPVDLAELIDSVVAEYNEPLKSRMHSVTVECRGGPVAIGIPRLVREALVNYLSNAIKYTPDGGEIRIKASGVDGRVRVAVTDNGVGIAPEKHARVFSEFVRLTTKDPRLGRVDGTGLGLSIVKKSIEFQAGSVGFTSRPGRGSTFWFELPAAECPPDVQRPAFGPSRDESVRSNEA